MHVRFRLNGETVETDAAPTDTLLDWLRERRGLKGTKEGCNEGDCGACTVMVTDEDGARPLNACILFMGQIDGQAVRTVEGIAGPDGELHPVQQAMIDHHGSQCGFCTPGFVVTMAAAHLNGARDHDDQLAGNLCRCTGYAPIVRAAEAAVDAMVPDWMHDAPLAPMDDAGARGLGETPAHSEVGADWGHRGAVPGTSASTAGGGAKPTGAVRPGSADELAAWCAEHPEATLVAGATDVGLWVTKGLRDLAQVAFLGGCHDLKRIEVTDDAIRIGAGVTMAALRRAMAPHHPSFAEFLRRFGSEQVRQAATVGGNVANASPIGDTPPALIALGATLHLRRGDARREMPLEAFFVEYGQQDRNPGEFVEAVTIPRGPDTLSCQKLSKRFDQDISAVCGCFDVVCEEGGVTRARIAFGGMAGTPKRATATEAALLGRPLTRSGIADALDALGEDFTPLSDMRASATYRLAAARGMLMRLADARVGGPASVLEVAP